MIPLDAVPPTYTKLKAPDGRKVYLAQLGGRRLRVCVCRTATQAKAYATAVRDRYRRLKEVNGRAEAAQASKEQNTAQ